MRGRGLPRWWVLPLEMFSMCTCYSRLHWRWFGYVSPFYFTTWPSLVLERFRFLLDHVSVPCSSTCLFSTGTRAVLPLDHVSVLYWSTCHIIIGPRVCFLFDHASWCCSSTCRIFIRPRGLTIFLPRVRFLIAHVSCPDQFTCHALVGPRVIFLFDHVACPGSTACRTNYIRKVIRDRHYYTDWQHNYSSWQSNTNN
jgi:hypothetical protein